MRRFLPSIPASTSDPTLPALGSADLAQALYLRLSEEDWGKFIADKAEQEDVPLRTGIPEIDELEYQEWRRRRG